MATDLLDVSVPMREKLAAAGDKPVLDSVFIPLKGYDADAEKVLGTKGWYISSPADGWTLHGPTDGG